MNNFETALVAYQEYIAAQEPQIAPQVNDIINRLYTTKVGFSGMGMGASSSSSDTAAALASDAVFASAGTDDSGFTPSSTPMTGTPLTLAQQSALGTTGLTPAQATTGALSNFIGSIGNLLSNKPQTQANTAALQAAAGQSAATQSTTMLLVVGAIAVIGLMALSSGGGGGRRR